MNYSIYAIIFIVKLISATLGNYRLILMSRGSKTAVGIVSLFASAAWLVSTALVVDDIASDPLIGAPYILAIVCGSYIGDYLDKKLKLGTSLVTVIIDDDEGKLKNTLIEEGFKTTTFNGKGLHDNKKIMIIATERKDKTSLLNLIHKKSSHNMIIGEKAEEILD